MEEKIIILENRIDKIEADLALTNQLNKEQERKLRAVRALLKHKIDRTLLVSIAGLTAMFILIIKVDLNTDSGQYIINRFFDIAVTLILPSAAVGVGVVIAKKKES